MSNRPYYKKGYRGYFLEGLTFGSWKVLSKSSITDYQNNALWDCVCVCGKQKPIIARNLVNGFSTNCGCVALSDRRLAFGEAAKNRLYAKYKSQAIRRDINFTLDFKEFILITESNCNYCGQPPSAFLGKSRYDSLHGFYKYNGIDRVDNEIGYEIGNCKPCCWNCNRMKGSLSREEFLFLVGKIYKFNK